MPCNSCEPRNRKSPGLSESLKNTNRFTRGVLNMAGEQSSLFMERLVNLAEDTIVTSIKLPRGICDFPEVECPPKIACTLVREVFPGERVVEPVIVRNLGHETKQFVFQTATMETIDGTQADPLVISPLSVTLAPGKSHVVSIVYNVTPNFLPGHRYSAAVQVKGYCEQTIQVVADVIALATAKCTVAQKECPTDRRHYWQDHFYCEPRKPQSKPVTPTKTVTDDDAIAADIKETGAAAQKSVKKS